MTRELNKQWRNDTRPPFRKPSPKRYGEERPSHSDRPRLSREVVDRGWEQGAQQRHADYQTRRNNHSSYQNGPKPASPSSQYRSRPNDHSGNNYRGNTRGFERPSSGPAGSRSQAFDPRRRNYREQNANDNAGFQHRPGNTGMRRGTSPQGHGYESRRFTSEDTRRSDNRQGYERPEPYQGQRPYQQRRRPFNNTYNNRSFTGASRHRTDSHTEGEFEGDYERFSDHDAYGEDHDPPQRHSHDAPTNRRPYNDAARTRVPRGQEPQRHVTELPNGRVLKGPRSTQRKAATFWTNVEEDTQDLLQHAPAPDTASHESQTDQPSQEKPQKPKQKSPKKEVVSVTSAKKVKGQHAGADADKKKPKARSNGPKPSRKGYKWPTP